MKAPAPLPTHPDPPGDDENTRKGINTRRSTVVRNIVPSNALTEPAAPPISVHSDSPVIPPNSVNGAIEGLSLVSRQLQFTNGNTGDGSANSTEETRSHLSNSSTKQHSSDKSVASATTFAMDEKESIRPDDSASVRAVDDEDTTSIAGRTSVITPEADVTLPPLRTILPRTGAALGASGTRRFQTLINPPRFGDLEAVTPEELNPAPILVQATQNVGAEDILRAPFVPILPDERLLDALASPKDRLPMLQLEERLLSLLKQSDAQFIDLPPQNSYSRLLAHKLADYYGLAHHITEDGMSVRIFRGNEAEIPMTLATLAKSIPIGPVAPSGPTAMKIMRRAGLNDSTAPSSSASKATSEAGHSEEGLASPSDSTPSRDKSKMTREEREAQYKAVRERIFGDFQELSVSESNSTGENSASMSRSSSSSGKKKSRRQKTPKDDSFEARSAFVPSYSHPHGITSQPSYQVGQYMDVNSQDPYNNPTSFYGAQMNYGTTPTQSHPGFDSHMPNFNAFENRQQFGAMEPWNIMQSAPYYGYPPSQMQGSYPMHQGVTATPPYPNQFSSGYHGPQHPSAWTGNQFADLQSSPASPTAGGPWQNLAGFGHGIQNVPHYPGAATVPIPELGRNNNRSLFNPQTRSFVPNASNSRTGSRSSNRKKPASGNGVPPPTARMSMPGRQLSGGSSASIPFPSKSNFTVQGAGIDAAEETLQKKYGTPANLPKKPPPPQAQQHPEYNIPGLRISTTPTANSVGNNGAIAGQSGPSA